MKTIFNAIAWKTRLLLSDSKVQAQVKIVLKDWLNREILLLNRESAG